MLDSRKLPDAPWIRQAERYGVDCVIVECPVCEQDCETIYKDANGEAVGCEKCIHTMDSFDWLRDETERMGYEYEADER